MIKLHKSKPKAMGRRFLQLSEGFRRVLVINVQITRAVTRYNHFYVLAAGCNSPQVAIARWETGISAALYVRICSRCKGALVNAAPDVEVNEVLIFSSCTSIARNLHGQDVGVQNCDLL